MISFNCRFRRLTAFAFVVFNLAFVIEAQGRITGLRPTATIESVQSSVSAGKSPTMDQKPAQTEPKWEAIHPAGRITDLRAAEKTNNNIIATNPIPPQRIPLNPIPSKSRNVEFTNQADSLFNGLSISYVRDSDNPQDTPPELPSELNATKPLAENRDVAASDQPPQLQTAFDLQQPKSPSILDNVGARPISLRESIHVSIASRRIFNSLSDGVVVEQLSSFEPEIRDQQTIAEESRFDPSISTLFAGNYVDRPSQSFFGPGLIQNNRRDEGEFQSRISKPWATGLTTSLGYEPSLAYLFFPQGFLILSIHRILYCEPVSHCFAVAIAKPISRRSASQSNARRKVDCRSKPQFKLNFVVSNKPTGNFTQATFS